MLGPLLVGLLVVGYLEGNAEGLLVGLLEVGSLEGWLDGILVGFVG